MLTITDIFALALKLADIRDWCASVGEPCAAHLIEGMQDRVLAGTADDDDRRILEGIAASARAFVAA